jgi:hypothetical protein
MEQPPKGALTEPLNLAAHAFEFAGQLPTPNLGDELERMRGIEPRRRGGGPGLSARSFQPMARAFPNLRAKATKHCTQHR